MSDLSDKKIFNDYVGRLTPRLKLEIFGRYWQLDKVVMWILSICFLAIMLLVLNFETFIGMNTALIKIAVILFVITIIFCVAHRVVYYFYEQKLSVLFSEGLELVRNRESGKPGPRDLPDDCTCEQIAEFLKEDMGYDFDSYLAHSIPLDIWKKTYEDFSKMWKTHADVTIDHVKTEFSMLLGITRTASERSDTEMKIDIHKLGVAGTYVYIGILATFVLAIVALSLCILTA